MKRTALLVVGLMLTALVGTASASSIMDPDDMTSPLDVRELWYKDKAEGLGTFKVITEENFRCHYLQKGLTTLKLYFDGKADGDNDLKGNFVCVKGANGNPRIVFNLHGTKSDSNYETLPVQRPNKHTLKVTIPLDLPELQGEHLDALAKVSDGAAEGCTSAHPCRERAPDAGRWHVY